MDVETPERTAAPAITRLRRYDDLPGPRALPGRRQRCCRLDSPNFCTCRWSSWCDAVRPDLQACRMGPRRA
jgi:hypothetical protein